MASDPSGSGTRESLALARWREGDARRRALARALHEPAPRSRRITDRLAELDAKIASYRVTAIAVHAKLVALERGGAHAVASLRHALIESSVQLEHGVRGLVDSDPSKRRAG